MKIDPPDWFDPAFVELVRREIAQADRDARILMYPELVDHRGKKDLFFTPGPRQTTRQDYRKYCKGCGCLNDDVTPGCINCSARHSMRRSNARRRARLA